jgi:hypothetical protein
VETVTYPKKHAEQYSPPAMVLTEDQLVKMRNKIRRQVKATAFSQGGGGIETMFRRLDKDGSGELDFLTLAGALRRFGANLTEDQMANVLKHMDTDENGRIGLTEFLEFIEADEIGLDHSVSIKTQYSNRAPKTAAHRRSNKPRREDEVGVAVGSPRRARELAAAAAANAADEDPEEWEAVEAELGPEASADCQRGFAPWKRPLTALFKSYTHNTAKAGAGGGAAPSFDTLKQSASQMPVNSWLQLVRGFGIMPNAPRKIRPAAQQAARRLFHKVIAATKDKAAAEAHASSIHHQGGDLRLAKREAEHAPGLSFSAFLMCLRVVSMGATPPLLMPRSGGSANGGRGGANMATMVCKHFLAVAVSNESQERAPNPNIPPVRDWEKAMQLAGIDAAAEDAEDDVTATSEDADGAGGAGGALKQARKHQGSISALWGTYEPTRVFESVFKGLTGAGDEAKGLLKAAWRDVDANGNGYASLAEVRTSIGTPYSSRCPHLGRDISPLPSPVIHPPTCHCT